MSDKDSLKREVSEHRRHVASIDREIAKAEQHVSALREARGFHCVAIHHAEQGLIDRGVDPEPPPDRFYRTKSGVEVIFGTDAFALV